MAIPYCTIAKNFEKNGVFHFKVAPLEGEHEAT